MAVAGGVEAGWNKLMMRVLAPTYANRSIVALPSPGGRRASAEALMKSATTKSTAAIKAGQSREPHPSSHWEDITWN
jgi:hypothetical protein